MGATNHNKIATNKVLVTGAIGPGVAAIERFLGAG